MMCPNPRAKAAIVVLFVAFTALGWFLIQSEAPRQMNLTAAARRGMIGTALIIAAQGILCGGFLFFWR